MPLFFRLLTVRYGTPRHRACCLTTTFLPHLSQRTCPTDQEPSHLFWCHLSLGKREHMREHAMHACALCSTCDERCGSVATATTSPLSSCSLNFRCRWKINLGGTMEMCGCLLGGGWRKISIHCNRVIGASKVVSKA